MDLPSTRLTFVLDGHITAVASELFDPASDTPTSRVAECRKPGDDYLKMSVGAFLLQSDGGSALIDLGWGPTAADVADLTDGALHGSIAGGGLLANLQTAGSSVEAIDYVYFSHLHADHVGWLLDERGVSTFPNARYVIPQTEWEFWTSQPPPPRSFTTPSADQLSELARCKIHAAQARTEFPLLRLLPLPGHTPGHSGVVVIDGSTRVLTVGDAVHCPAELADSPVTYRGNVDPALARKSLALLQDWCATPTSHLACGHFADGVFYAPEV